MERTEDPDAPVDALDALAQRYLDGTLSPEEEERAGALLDGDAAFGERIAGYASLFAALDRHGHEAPEGLAAAAVRSAWGAAAPATVGWLEIFGGMRRGLSVFAALDLLLAVLLIALLVTRGPVALLSAWLLGIKDVLVFVVRAAPTPEAVALLLPGLLLLTAGLLGGVLFGLRVLLVAPRESR